MARKNLVDNQSIRSQLRFPGVIFLLRPGDDPPIDNAILNCSTHAGLSMHWMWIPLNLNGPYYQSAAL